MKIGFLGFGEAARAFCDSLRERDTGLSFIAYDILLEDEAGAPDMRAAMARHGVAIAESRSDLSEADWIVSAVTADQSLVAVEPLLEHLHQGQWLIDTNSVSPDRKRETAARVEERNCLYLDMAVMAPVHPRGHRTPVLLAGANMDDILGDLDRLEFDYKLAGEEAGKATAIKMVRSLFVKGLEAITVETLLAAKASDCFDEILASISSSYPGLGWPQFAAYEFERTLKHGKRRAAEMRESAATVDALGLRGALAGEIAEIQDEMGALSADAPSVEDLSAGVEKVLAARLRR